MKIVLIGFMGSGKTTVAKLLGAQLGLPVIEVDELIIKRSGLNSVNEIFNTFGEEHFRNLELQVIQELVSMDNIVISPGGGLVMNEANVVLLRSGPPVTFCFLDTSFETIKSRIGCTKTRPLFQNEHEALTCFNDRLPTYKLLADISINTDSLSPNEIANQIQKLIIA